MSDDLRWTHTDSDGDTIHVGSGMYGAIIGAECPAAGMEALVAVRYEHLPHLIATLQDILAESNEATS